VEFRNRSVRQKLIHQKATAKKILITSLKLFNPAIFQTVSKIQTTNLILITLSNVEFLIMPYAISAVGNFLLIKWLSNNFNALTFESGLFDKKIIVWGSWSSKISYSDPLFEIC
jgi:hypothetical protein